MADTISYQNIVWRAWGCKWAEGINCVLGRFCLCVRTVIILMWVLSLVIFLGDFLCIVRDLDLLGNSIWRGDIHCVLIFLVFAWATDLSTDLECQLSVSCKCYEAAYEILLFSNLKKQNPEQHVQVLKRMGNIRNEIGVFYMNQAAAVQTERVGKHSCFASYCMLFHRPRKMIVH